MLLATSEVTIYEPGAAHLRYRLPVVVEPRAVWVPGFRPAILLLERTERAFGVLLDPADVQLGRRQWRVSLLWRRLGQGLSQGRQRLPDRPAACDPHQLSLAAERRRS